MKLHFVLKTVRKYVIKKKTTDPKKRKTCLSLKRCACAYVHAREREYQHALTLSRDELKPMAMTSATSGPALRHVQIYVNSEEEMLDANKQNYYIVT